MRQLKGFSLRRPGRPVGSRAIDRVQSDLFPFEKVLSQCGWQNLRFPAASARSAEGARTEEPEQQKRLPPRLLTGGERLEEASFEELWDFCEF